MKIGLTGATGFIGRYIVQHLVKQNHQLKCWYRNKSKIETVSHYDSFASERCEWIRGELGDQDSTDHLVSGCDAIVHSALWKPGETFRGGEGDIIEFCERNILGSLKLIEAARAAGVQRFIFISTGAVHEQILDDRPLDEAHPLWPLSHYGAHKAAMEKFVHSYGLGMSFNICALRPTGVYGLDDPAENSKWFSLVKKVSKGETVEVEKGGKEVHAADVAKAIGVLLKADPEKTTGQSFNCFDRYVSKHEVAQLAKKISGSNSQIEGQATSPKHQIETTKIRELGMSFGGEPLLRATIEELVAVAT